MLEQVIERLAQACKRLELDMWDRLHRHADVADLKVVIRRVLEEMLQKPSPPKK